MSDNTPRPITDLDDQRLARAAASVFASAAAVVAAAEAVVMRENVDAAEITAAAAWASVPIDIAHIFETERIAWLEARRARALAVEHSQLALQSVMAATVAARALSSGLGEDEYDTSDAMAEGIAALVAARRVANDSQHALIAMTQINFARATSWKSPAQDDAA